MIDFNYILYISRLDISYSNNINMINRFSKLLLFVKCIDKINIIGICPMIHPTINLEISNQYLRDDVSLNNYFSNLEQFKLTKNIKNKFYIVPNIIK